MLPRSFVWLVGERLSSKVWYNTPTDMRLLFAMVRRVTKNADGMLETDISARKERMFSNEVYLHLLGSGS